MELVIQTTKSGEFACFSGSSKPAQNSKNGDTGIVSTLERLDFISYHLVYVRTADFHVFTKSRTIIGPIVSHHLALSKSA